MTARHHRWLICVAILAATATACGGAGSAPSATQRAGTVTHGGGPNLRSFNSVTGHVTAVANGHSAAKVRADNGTTTTVAFGAVTRFTRNAATSRDAIAVGDCIAVTNNTVVITGTSGCQARPPRTFAQGPTPRPFPSGSPRTFLRGPAGQRGHGVVGTVKAIDANTISVSALVRQSTETVHTTASTKYRTSSSVKATDVATGDCVAAVGQKTSTGVLDAFAVVLTVPTGGTCPAGPAPLQLGGFGFRSSGGTNA